MIPGFRIADDFFNKEDFVMRIGEGLELTDTKKNDKIVIKLLTKSMNMKQNSAIQ